MIGIIIGLSLCLIYCIYELYRYINKQSKSVSFKESLQLTGLPIITLMSNNRNFNFLLDSGSKFNVINLSELKFTEHKMLEDNHYAHGIDGNMTECKCCDINLNYNNLKFNQTFDVIELDKAFNIIKNNSGVTIHGILGNDFFIKYKYVLDFENLKFYKNR